jgi:hypothetical protein
MKTIMPMVKSAVCLSALVVVGNSTLQAQNLLTDPGFESGTEVPSGVGGWQTFNGAVFSTAVARTGTYSMLNGGPGGYTVPGAVEFLSSSAGLEYDLSGYGYVSSEPTGASQGFLQITFFSGANGTGSNLGTVETSAGNALASNKITSSSPTDSWISLDTGIAEAPVGTQSVGVYTLVLDANATSVYFDDLTLTAVPEPSSLALLTAGLGLPFYFWRRRNS